MAINSFDNDSGKRSVRSVGRTEHSPLQSPTYRRRSRSRSSGSFVSDLPFSLSITKVDDVFYASISSGVIITDIQNVIPTGLVDLSSFSIGSTVYIYLKVANNWFDGDNPRNYPELTIISGDDLTNFYGNDSKFPVSDVSNSFYQIGKILVSDDEKGGKKYEITDQIAKENAVINEVLLNGFSLLRLLEGKSNDIDDDINYLLTMNFGNVKLPDKSNIVIPSETESVAISGFKSVYIKISATVNTDGFFENLNGVSEFSENPVADTSTVCYFIVGFVDNKLLTLTHLFSTAAPWSELKTTSVSSSVFSKISPIILSNLLYMPSTSSHNCSLSSSVTSLYLSLAGSI